MRARITTSDMSRPNALALVVIRARMSDLLCSQPLHT